MKRILGLAALLGHALGAATGIQVYGGARGARGARGGRVKRPVYGKAYFSSSRPTAARWWHNLEQPGQCARLQAAKDKRQRRGLKRAEDLARSVHNNWAHGIGKPGFNLTALPDHTGRLNPFYVAK